MVPGGALVGMVEGQGPPVLVLHGGPGLSFSYIDGLVQELAPAYRVAIYQQRGLAPSTTSGPFTVETHVADVISVLDALGWPVAHVVGHSWGGYLMLAAAARAPDRLLGGLGVDSIGVIGDGGISEFERALYERMPPHTRDRVDELDRRTMNGDADEAGSIEAFRLAWPAYFASPAHAPPMPEVRMSARAYSETLDSMEAGRANLASHLSTVEVPINLIYGASSPIPASASTDLADHMPFATATAVLDAGHYLWMERPGVVRDAFDRLVAGAPRL
jgi:pimeloyl-ACP methyl ester carboxylesterase